MEKKMYNVKNKGQGLSNTPPKYIPSENPERNPSAPILSNNEYYQQAKRDFELKKDSIGMQTLKKMMKNTIHQKKETIFKVIKREKYQKYFEKHGIGDHVIEFVYNQVLKQYQSKKMQNSNSIC